MLLVATAPLLHAQTPDAVAANDQAVQWLREARREASPRLAQQRREAALTLLDQAARTAASDYQRRRACFDRVVALSELGRFQQALDAFADHCAGEFEPPAYVWSALGDSHAGLQQPQEALEAYERALQLADADEGPFAGRIFALLDLDRIDEAEDALQERLDQGRSPQPRDDRLRLEMIRAWDGATDAAMAAINELAEAAPDDAELARHQGRIEMLRGRPEAALAAYDRAIALAPGYIGLVLDRVSALDRLGRGREGDAVVAGLSDEAPDWAPLRRLEEQRRRDRGIGFDSRVRAARGGDREIAAGEVRFESTLTSAVFAHDWRAYLARRRAYADFRGSALEDSRWAAGLRWFRNDLRLQFELDRPDDRYVDESGALLALDWRIDDDWSLGASAARNAFDLPLRARQAGTTGDRYALAARFAPRGQFYTRWSAGVTDYSDGNRRDDLGWSAQWLHPLGHRVQLSLSPALYWGRNRRDDVPYFSPLRDGSAELAAALDHRLFARIGHRHHQKLEAWIGRYHQAGFAAATIGGLHYEYRIAFAPGRGAYLRVGRDRRAYDGVPEFQSFVELGLQLSW